MESEGVVAWIRGAFDRIEHVETDGNWFFFFDPDHLFPFATLVTNDLRSGVRPGPAGHLSPEHRRRPRDVGSAVRRATKRQQGQHGLGSGSDADFDFTALDVVMPHPVYGRQHWLCVLNSSEATFESLKPALTEAWEIDRARSLGKRSSGARYGSGDG